VLEVEAGGGGARVDEVLAGSKNCAALWLMLMLDLVVVEVLVVEGLAEEEVTSGSTNPGETQIVVVTPIVSVSYTQSVTTTVVSAFSRLWCLAWCGLWG
jgi:hypothetical protein